MIVTELYDGQGLGNQLWCAVVARVIALDAGFEYGIMSPHKFKGSGFLDFDFGQQVIGGSGPEGGTPRTLPEGIRYYYNERKLVHPGNGADIRTHDSTLVAVPDGTKIDGIMQDEQYIAHRKDEIRAWLKVRPESVCLEYANDATCVINFRGGEYVGLRNVFLARSYWKHAVAHMKKINSSMRFVVVTDDVQTARKFFPGYPVIHRGIGADFSIIQNARYLILSNSSFAWFPAWTNTDLKFCIAPKYWAFHNVSDGYWSCGYNLTTGWQYQDRDGKLFSYEECQAELSAYTKRNAQMYSQTQIRENFLVVSNYYNDLSWVPEYTDRYGVYDQSDTAIYSPKLDTGNVIKSEHLGHNIRDYCTFIIDNYDSLPERTVFVSGNVFPRHIMRDRFDALVNSTVFAPLEDRRKHRPRWPVSMFSKTEGYREINNSWYLSNHPTKYFHTYNDFLRFCFADPVIPAYVTFAPGANYVVPKANILKLPKVFYENLRTFVSHSPKAIPGESHIIERALYTMWTADYSVSEQMLRPVDDTFEALPKRRATIARRAIGFVLSATADTLSFARRAMRKIASTIY